MVAGEIERYSNVRKDSKALITVSNPITTPRLVELALLMRTPTNAEPLLHCT